MVKKDRSNGENKYSNGGTVAGWAQQGESFLFLFYRGGVYLLRRACETTGCVLLSLNLLVVVMVVWVTLFNLFFFCQVLGTLKGTNDRYV